MVDVRELQALPIWRQLALIRIARGLTQQSVARRAGVVGEIYLSKVERGHRPLTAGLEQRLRAAIEIETIEGAGRS
jgi:transcriptional regulator with XRE-family HTH domain